MAFPHRYRNGTGTGREPRPSRWCPELNRREGKGTALPAHAVIAPVETVEKSSLHPPGGRATEGNGAAQVGEAPTGRAPAPRADPPTETSSMPRKVTTSNAAAQKLPTLFELTGNEPVNVPLVAEEAHKAGKEITASRQPAIVRVTTSTCHYCEQPVHIEEDAKGYHHTIHVEQKKCPNQCERITKGTNTVKKKKKAPRPQGRKLPRSRKVKTLKPVRALKSVARKVKRIGKKKRTTSSAEKVKTSPRGKVITDQSEGAGTLIAASPKKKVAASPPAVTPKPLDVVNPKPTKCTRPEPHCLCCTKRPKPVKRESWEGPAPEPCRNCNLNLERLPSGKKDGFYYRHEQYPSYRDKPARPKGWKPCTEK